VSCCLCQWQCWFTDK